MDAPREGNGFEPTKHDPRSRVFVSSTLGELKSEREAAKSAIKTLRLEPIGIDLGARDGQDGLTIADADIFVGIYWQSFGWESDLDREYEASSGLPGLIYVKEPGPDREEGLTDLLARARSDGRATIRAFESPGELAEMLVEDLANVISDSFARTEPHPDSLPGGTLTFMFGDLAGSTTLVERLGDRYADVLAGYHQVVADATLRHGGTVVDLEGERLFSVFQDAFQAVSATVEIQRSLGDRVWPDSVSVPARLGLHTGTARIGSGGYVGLDVHRASRVASSAHGGQIVVSAPVRELVEGQTENVGWEIKDLGSFALKGLSRAEKLFQVRAPGLRADFPPPRAR
ncbi:MAG: DUF4062 domain-containing protein, partial [Acidimicrobiia bacterium]